MINSRQDNNIDSISTASRIYLGEPSKKQLENCYHMFHLHVVHEQRMVCSGRNNSDFDSVLWIPVQELIINKDLQIVNSTPIIRY